jgi:hypothetical protein
VNRRGVGQSLNEFVAFVKFRFRIKPVANMKNALRRFERFRYRTFPERYPFALPIVSAKKHS